jgi:hypothetical protein
MSQTIGSKVYIVFARATPGPCELEMLGIFDSMERANQFLDRAPSPQCRRLEIHTRNVNESTTDPFWTGGEAKERQ